MFDEVLCSPAGVSAARLRAEKILTGLQVRKVCERCCLMQNKLPVSAGAPKVCSSLSRKRRELVVKGPPGAADSPHQQSTIAPCPRIMTPPSRLLPPPPTGGTLTLGEAWRVVVDVAELDSDGGGPGQSTQVSPHVLGLQQHQVLVLGLPVHVGNGRAQNTCETDQFSW